MEGASEDDFPCSSLTADSFIRIGLAGSAWGLFLGPYEAKKRGKGVFDVRYLFTKAEFINDYCHITFWIGNGNNPILFKKKEICGFPTSYSPGPPLRQHDYWSLQEKPAKWDLQKTFCSATQRFPEVKSVGKYGLQCGLFAGVFTATCCGVRRYRMEKDWVNACIAGAVTGAAVAVRTRNWMQIVGTATFVSAIATVADYSTAN